MSARVAPEGYRLDSWGDIACLPGVPLRPVLCERHSEHHFCRTCEGYFGVPHDLIHEPGPWEHPLHGSRDCACRPCRIHHAKT